MLSTASANGNAHSAMVLRGAGLGDVGPGHFRALMTDTLHETLRM
jgi:hypothetical protein